MKVLVIGAGAIGSYFGASLADAGQDVTFLVRGERLNRYRSSGISIKSICGDFALPFVCTITAEEIAISDDEYEVVLLAVKSPQVSDLTKVLSRVVQKNTLLVSLLNGVHQKERLSKVLPTFNLCTGIANIIVSEGSIGNIEHTGVAPHITLESMTHSSKQITLQFEELNTALLAANIKFSIKDDIRRSLWQKFCFVAPWGVLASAMKLPIGEIVADEYLHSQLTCLIAEYVAIACAQGVKLDAHTAKNIIKAISKLPAESTTSMQRDFAQGKVGEYDALCEYPYQYAKSQQIDIPVLSYYYDLLTNQCIAMK